MSVRISGIAKVLERLAREAAKLERRAEKGVTEAAALVRREGQIETPVDTGNLINSWYGPELHHSIAGPVAQIGLTASYAVFVHEMVGAHFKKPGSKAKFLEDPLKRNESRIIDIIVKEIVIP